MSPLKDDVREEGKTETSAQSSKPASGLLLLGVNHTTAPVAMRERLAIPTHRLGDATRILVDQPGVREAMILSTCNRVELLTVHDESLSGPQAEQSVRSGGLGENGRGPAMRLARFFDEYLQVGMTDIEPHLYQYREREAIRHLFRVASSLDSMVVGEPQILGQVKQSWTVGREVGAVKSMLDPLLQRAFSVAKKVRTETQIGNTTVSVASVAAELARKIFGLLEGKTVLMVGAGKMSELTARHLIRQGATKLMVSNRTESRAQAIADDLRAAKVSTEVIPLHKMQEQAHRADIVITSTGAGQIFTREQARSLMQRRKNRPIFFIDIAVPRDVASEVNDIEGCFVYDIDDLQQVAIQNKAVRGKEAEAAEAIIAREVERYADRISHVSVTEAIKELLLQAETVRQQELVRIAHQLSGQPLTTEQMAAVDRLTKSLTGKLLHPQIAALRESAEEREF
ncbi:MAG: glutamyl-tRNA reductase [Acidobacteriaceae bacterium]